MAMDVVFQKCLYNAVNKQETKLPYHNRILTGETAAKGGLEIFITI